MANLRVADVEATKSFYTDYLGLSTEEFNMGWVTRYTSPETSANVQLVTRDATASEDSVIWSTRMTSKVPMKKRRNSATRSCTR
jgi:predicted enzyme related to lactoylglutathione lyase